ncbi:histidine phosphatase family protein [Enterococcus sp. BWB1-3]|uniref:histidine phosphatase family protein n=1 Tax=unclassified Enterococcus TaxID=2608891 RepID=UPI001924CCCD|nr:MULTISPECIES: histidine phosphatase family protein [unclassified Enterococcus]MBL1229710.1 histidine phosphatase family protein [Enterococcus sp. BWB1-3]MCB5952849.1 phosphoglycerate mutase family protein [Enterococcus sp. BWT-B8]MCB5953858.1 phosphoglycerate mutase family protein [Enterococcus sp. CWB-B31]
MKKVKVLCAVLVAGFVLAGCSSGDDKIDSVQESISTENTETVFYFIRHGKTMFNTTDQVQGWSDTPLTNAGIQGAKDLAVGLKNVPFTLAYSSDLGRAVSTANYILEEGDREGLELQTSAGLREWNYGGYEGRDNSEMWAPIFEAQGLKFDDEWSQYAELTEKLSDEDIANEIAKNDPTQTAETYDEIVKRSKEAMDEIIAASKEAGGGNVLIVAHGSEIPTILEFLVPSTYKGESIGNCSVTTLHMKDGQMMIDTIGDTSYLEAGEKANK